MAFQAPFDIVGMRQQNFREQQAAQQQQQQMFAGISGAIDNLMGAYLEREQRVAKGKAMKNAFNVIAPSLGMDEATLQQFTGELKSPMDWYNFGESVGPFLPSAINANMARDRNAITQRGQTIQMQMPMNRAAATAAGNAAAGQATVRPMTMPGVDLNFVD